MSINYEYSSHETFSHDSLDSLGYDWERIANPNIHPRYPLKVYLPQSTEDIVQIVNEIKILGQVLKIRSKGHSSNDLVLEDKGSVLCTEKLNQILTLNKDEMTVTVQSGTILAQLDEYLSKHGYGLPIIGDHNHITAGGFASVGGISPASHRYGLFVDNVRQLEYVNWNGELITCSKQNNREELDKVLAGTGKYGVIATITCEIIRVDKYTTILKNNRSIYWNVDKFIEGSGKFISDPGAVLMERGVWLDFGNIKVGQFSAYQEVAQNQFQSLRNRLAYNYLHTLGYWAGRLPTQIDMLVKALGITGIILSPRYASIKNIEVFTDKILDSTVGDPSRMLIVLAPVEKYALLFRKLYDLSLDYRTKYGCFTLISFYVKSIHSNYLAQGDPQKRFCELMFYLGVEPTRLTATILDEVVSQIDDLCVEHGAFRYMHTKTVKDVTKRQKVDPNTFWSAQL